MYMQSLYLSVSQNAWFAVTSTDALVRMEPEDSGSGREYDYVVKIPNNYDHH